MLKIKMIGAGLVSGFHERALISVCEAELTCACRGLLKRHYIIPGPRD